MESANQVGDRLKQVITHYQLNVNQASQKLGHSSASKFYKFLSGGIKPGFESLVEVLGTFPEISGDWLLMGRGPMLRMGLEGPASGAIMATPPTVPQRAVTSGQVLAVTVDHTGKENMLLVSVQAQAGYQRQFNEPKFLKDMTSYSLPGFTGATYRAFEVSGDSMTPTYKHGDLVVCSFVERWDLLKPHESYVLVTAENVLLKRLVAPITDRRGTIELHSDNAGQYGAYSLPVADLLELWMVRGFISTNAPGRPDTASEKLREAIEALGHNYQEVIRFLNNSAQGSVELRGPLLDVS